MNTKHLKTFVTLAKKKSFLKTSMELHYAESTLSDHINLLERELGVKLIETGTRGCKLTKAGEVFLTKAEEMLGLWADTQQEMLRLSGMKGIRIVSAESLALNMLPPIYTEFIHKYKNVPLSISNGSPASFAEQLKTHEVDIALGYYWGKLPGNKFESTQICQDRLVFFASPEHRLAGMKKISLAEMANELFVFTRQDSVYYEEASKMFSRAGVDLKTSFFIDSAELIKKYVIDSRHIGFLAESTVKHEVDTGNLILLDVDNPSVMIDIVAVTLMKKRQEPMIQELIHIAKKTCCL